MANGGPTLTDDERQRQLAALAASGQFPGAAPALKQSILQGMGGGTQQPSMPVQPPPPQQPGPQGATPPPQQAQQPPAAAPQQSALAPQGPPQMRLPGQSGIMGFLGNPMVTGLLTGYLNAIRTPRYAGRGSLIANAGLGFLTGMSGAEQAMTDQEKAQLEMEKQQQDIDRERQSQAAVERIRGGSTNPADYILAHASEVYDKQQERQQTLQDKADRLQVNSIKKAQFLHGHPDDPFAAEVVAGVEQDPFAIADESKWEDTLQSIHDAPDKKNEILARTHASDAAVAASQAKTRADEAEQKWVEKQDPATQREYYMRTGTRPPTTWVLLDPKTNREIDTTVVPAGESPPSDPRGKWIPMGDYKGLVSTEKRNVQVFVNPDDPKDMANVNLNDPGSAIPTNAAGKPFIRASAVKTPVMKTYWDGSDPSTRKDYDMRTSAPGSPTGPPDTYVEYKPGVTEKPFATAKRGMEAAKDVIAQYVKTHADDPEPMLSAWSTVQKKKHEAWKKRVSDWGLANAGLDPFAPNLGGTSATPRAPGTATPAPTPAPTEAPTPTARLSADDLEKKAIDLLGKNPGSTPYTGKGENAGRHGVQLSDGTVIWLD